MAKKIITPLFLLSNVMYLIILLQLLRMYCLWYLAHLLNLIQRIKIA
jgi:hypothetical protein